jgi:zinc/manganese transport system substrate-binding protein
MKSLIFAGLLILLSGPGSANAKDIDAVASFTVLADMARQIGGAHVHVRSLIGPNGDPHAYEPTPQDAAALRQADLIFVNGLGLEGWIDRLIRASGTEGTVIVASDGIVVRTRTKDGSEIPDPHAWNSAANGALYAANIAKALIAADPADAAAYRANDRRYEAELRGLDTWARQEVATIPADRRKVITGHGAFGYMGAAYGIEFRAPVGFSTEAETSASTVAALIDQIKRDKITAVFIENSNDPRLVEQIAAATGVRVGKTLYAEALSPADGPAPTYAAMFRYNIETLVSGMRAN